jgi:hypothetical protein
VHAGSNSSPVEVSKLIVTAIVCVQNELKNVNLKPAKNTRLFNSSIDLQLPMQSVPITLTLWVCIPFRRGVLDTTLCDKICQWLACQTGRWFSPRTLVSSTNKTDHHNITEILLKVALNTVTPNPWPYLHGFQIFWPLAYLINFIIETRRAH